jgi:aryl-alcohol dehydrogenase-like predicted oxidoreductase
MHTRTFGKLGGQTGTQISEVGVGCWQLGGDWGQVSDEQALASLTAAADAGVTFIDTADVYGLGRSESLIGQFIKQHGSRDQFFIASKLGRHPEPGWPDNFSAKIIAKHTEDSLQRLGIDALDLTQTHCIPHDMMKEAQVWDALREIQKAGLIRHFGASVESMDEALTCLEVEGLASLQIIFNIFRQKPIKMLFDKAKAAGVALIVRLPLASGLLAGKFTAESTFAPEDHRNYNRDGQQFNVGETFAGLPFEKGVELADAIKTQVPQSITPESMTMAQMALRWCLDFDAVSVVIPGAKNAEQAQANAAASDLPPLSPELHEHLRTFYRQSVKEHIRGAY